MNDFPSIDKKQQARWEEAHLFASPRTPGAKKFYCLDMFPYPSGAGLHVGHPEGYTASDILTRYKRMNGYSVLHPMGWDAFGLPAENYAIATGVHPRITTQKNIDNFRRQIKSIGLAYDWSREVDTTDPNYYKWTQWIFLQLFKKGLAYESTVPINWCPSCKTGLANEEVFNGKCERCGHDIERKALRQWILKITDYAEKLLEGLDKLDWPESTLTMQKNWIGKSQGANVIFKLDGFDDTLTVFTTRPDTLFGATYMVVSPEHPILEKIVTPEQKAAVAAYQKEAAKKSDLERGELNKEKTGVFTGAYAINPVNGVKIPVWTSDYVLMGYGTGAIMAVPAHDERDYAFAKKFGLKIIEVIKSEQGVDKEAFTGDGELVNSGFLNGLRVKESKAKMIAWLSEHNVGNAKTTYKLRDWVFARQRYWGEPIPVVHCDKCGVVPLPESELPLTLPQVEKFEPSGTGEMDPHNDKALVDPALEKAWGPVDCYIGGAEHAVLHLLYARFWHRVLFDLGVLSHPEPFQKLRHQGMILAFSYRDKMGNYHAYDEIDFKDGKAFLKTTGEELSSMVEKMSKSKKNVINPDEILNQYGADAFRMYEMFMGPFDAQKPWDMKGIEGINRFLKRIYAWSESVTFTKEAEPKKSAILLNQTIAKVADDIENLRFNTAISALMVLFNDLSKLPGVTQETFQKFIQILHPFAPHLTEEIWQQKGYEGFVLNSTWPTADKALLQDDTVDMGVQINGKVRERLLISRNAPREEIEQQALASAKVQSYLKELEIKKVIVVPGRMVSIVAAPKK